MTISYTAADAKQKFGKLIDDAQSKPVSITKHNREIAVVMSADQLKTLSRLILNDFFYDAVINNEMTMFDAIERQKSLEANINSAIEQHENQQTKVADDAFFEGIKSQAKLKAKSS